MILHDSFIKLLYYLVIAHKIQAQARLGYNILDIPWIEFYRTLDLRNTEFGLSWFSKNLYFKYKCSKM